MCLLLQGQSSSCCWRTFSILKIHNLDFRFKPESQHWLRSKHRAEVFSPSPLWCLWACQSSFSWLQGHSAILMLLRRLRVLCSSLSLLWSIFPPPSILCAFASQAFSDTALRINATAQRSLHFWKPNGSIRKGQLIWDSTPIQKIFVRKSNYIRAMGSNEECFWTVAGGKWCWGEVMKRWWLWECKVCWSLCGLVTLPLTTAGAVQCKNELLM